MYDDFSGEAPTGDPLTRSLDICAVRNHATVAEAGACPRCRQEFIDAEAHGPYAWILSFPETEQIAVVRSWIPDADAPLATAWATGCNTGGRCSCTPLDPVLIEAAGVELFTLLSGSDADHALDALGAR